MKKYTHVTIDRRKWSRGKLIANALLINRKLLFELSPADDYPLPKVGKMCCLGFACLTLGATARKIAGQVMPMSVNAELPGLSDRGHNTAFSEAASGINDDGEITDKEREKQLKKLARKNGFIFKFVN